jgi:hypothetical protein
MGMMPRLLGSSVLATVLAGAFTLLNAPTALALDNDATSFKLEAGAYFPKVQNLPLPHGLAAAAAAHRQWLGRGGDRGRSCGL